MSRSWILPVCIRTPDVMEGPERGSSNRHAAISAAAAVAADGDSATSGRTSPAGRQQLFAPVSTRVNFEKSLAVSWHVTTALDSRPLFLFSARSSASWQVTMDDLELWAIAPMPLKSSAYHLKLSKRRRQPPVAGTSQENQHLLSDAALFKVLLSCKCYHVLFINVCS